MNPTESKPLYVTTYRNPNTGEILVMHADHNRGRLGKDDAFTLRLHRILAATRFHRLLGMRRHPIDFDSVATHTYTPTVGDGETEG